jgi:hypothetical protein
MSSEAGSELASTLTLISSIISSKPFRFSVGLHKREFTIHSAVVAHQSTALSSLVNGEMKEARDFHVTWESVDEETFIHFSQYTYTGDYDGAQSPLIQPGLDAVSHQGAPLSKSLVDLDCIGSQGLTEKKRKKKSILWDEEDDKVPKPKKKKHL